jgi:hypothetical protein
MSCGSAQLHCLLDRQAVCGSPSRLPASYCVHCTHRLLWHFGVVASGAVGAVQDAMKASQSGFDSVITLYHVMFVTAAGKALQIIRRR